MDKNILSTTYDFKLANGETVKLTLNFYFLYQLRSKNEPLYKKYNQIMQSMSKNNLDILDMVTICYVAYVCANLNAEEVLSEEDFYMLCGSDMKGVGDAVQRLVTPKN